MNSKILRLKESTQIILMNSAKTMFMKIGVHVLSSLICKIADFALKAEGSFGNKLCVNITGGLANEVNYTQNCLNIKTPLWMKDDDLEWAAPIEIRSGDLIRYAIYGVLFLLYRKKTPSFLVQKTLCEFTWKRFFVLFASAYILERFYQKFCDNFPNGPIPQLKDNPVYKIIYESAKKNLLSTIFQGIYNGMSNKSYLVFALTNSFLYVGSTAPQNQTALNPHSH